jgi:hypothetical protein
LSCALLLEIGAIVPAVARAEQPGSDRLLIAQQIVEGLPPPPDMPEAGQALPPPLIQSPAQPESPRLAPTPLPAAQSAPQSMPATDRRSDRAASNSPESEQYLVYVNGDSPLLLDQVRRVASDAFVQRYDGQQVIQAGLFAGEASAQQQAAVLAAQGIGAEVAAVSQPDIPAAPPATIAANQTMSAQALPLVPVDRTIDGQPPLSQFAPNDAIRVAQASRYYVVIPGRASDLGSIADLVTLLGQDLIDNSERSIQERRSPLGPHVLVGPFVNRRAASRWNRYLRDFGLDARVYYDR